MPFTETLEYVRMTNLQKDGHRKGYIYRHLMEHEAKDIYFRTATEAEAFKADLNTIVVRLGNVKQLLREHVNLDTVLGIAIQNALDNHEAASELILWLRSQATDSPSTMEGVLGLELTKGLLNYI